MERENESSGNDNSFFAVLRLHDDTSEFTFALFVFLMLVACNAARTTPIEALGELLPVLLPGLSSRLPAQCRFVLILIWDYFMTSVLLEADDTNC